MAIQRTLWKPDTHPNTEVLYEWDSSAPEDAIVLTPVSVVIEGVHQDDPVSAYAIILDANQRKNKAAAIMEEYSVPFTFDFEDDHVTLDIFCSNVDAQTEADIRARFDADFNGSVKLIVG